MLVRPTMLDDLNYIYRKGGLEDGVFIYSLWEGYMKEPATKKLLDFINEHGLRTHVLHTSGHADIETLQKVVQALRPRQIIPIHTFHPGLYQEKLGRTVKVLADGESIGL